MLQVLHLLDLPVIVFPKVSRNMVKSQVTSWTMTEQSQVIRCWAHQKPFVWYQEEVSVIFLPIRLPHHVVLTQHYFDTMLLAMDETRPADHWWRIAARRVGMAHQLGAASDPVSDKPQYGWS